MLIPGCVHIELPVYQVIDMRLLWCELQKVGDVVVRHSVSSRWLTLPDRYARSGLFAAKIRVVP